MVQRVICDVALFSFSLGGATHISRGLRRIYDTLDFFTHEKSIKVWTCILLLIHNIVLKVSWFCHGRYPRERT